MVAKLPVPNETLDTSDTGVGFQTKMNTMFTAVKNAITAFNNQVDSYQLASDEAAKAKTEADKAATVVLAPLLLIRNSKLDNPLTHLFKKNKLVDTLKGGLSWERDSGATYIDRYGVLQYSPSKTATNLLLHSEDFSNFAWANGSNVSVVPNYGVAPDGSMTADLVNLVNADSHQSIQTFSQIDGERYTFSAWLKSDRYSETSFQIAYYDGGTYKDDVRVKLTSEFQRFEFSFTAIAGNASPQIRINAFGHGDDGDSFQIWGCQLEKSRVANGYIKTEATSVTGVSSFGIDQSRQEKEGWLIEGASTNLLTYSEDVTHNNWVKTGVATLAGENSGLAPNGSMTADKIVHSSNTGVHYVYQPTSTVGEWTVSIFFKAAEFNTAGFDVFSAADGTVGACIVDLTNGVLSEITGNAKSKVIGNGWVRVSLTVTTTDTTSYVRIYPNNRNSSTGDDTSGVMVWGAQLEALPFATSYIPTTDSASSRTDEFVSIPFYGNVPHPNESVSISCEFSLLAARSGTDIAGLLGWSTNTESLQLFASNGYTGGRMGSSYSGVNADSITAPVAGVPVSFVYSYDSVEMLLYTDGVKTGVRARTPIVGITVPDILRIGKSQYSGRYIFGHLNDLRINDIALNDSEVKFLAGE